MEPRSEPDAGGQSSNDDEMSHAEEGTCFWCGEALDRDRSIAGWWRCKTGNGSRPCWFYRCDTSEVR